MASVRMRFSHGFLPGAGIPRMFFCVFSSVPVEIRATLKQPHFTFADTLWSRISRRVFFSRIFRCFGRNENHAIEQPHLTFLRKGTPLEF
jgi:hypothetical protein